MTGSRHQLANCGVYDTAVVGPALAFVESLGAGLRTFAPSVRPGPRIGGSLFRTHRDTRFSGDKSPYKTYVGIRFRDGDTMTSSKCTGPFFYVEFDTTSLRLGVGVKELDNATLAAYRHAVANRRAAKVLGDRVDKARAKDHDILGDMLSRVPSTYAEQQDNEMRLAKGLRRLGVLQANRERVPPLRARRPR